MFITHLRLRNVRNLRSAEVDPARGLNIVLGQNGSGKTSLLEAIYLLGRGRSFRTSHLGEVITFGEADMLGFARAHGNEGIGHSVGVEYRRKEGVTAKIDGRSVGKLSELARILPVLFLGGGRSLLLASSPQVRREFLDWGLFHVEPDFIANWRRYGRALAQRNAALKSKRPVQEIQSWDQELSETGQCIASLRSQHVSDLVPILSDVMKELAAFAIGDVDVVIDRGWPIHNTELREILQRDLDRDRHVGFTRSGPHRADWDLRMLGHSARQFCSAGQQKVFVCGLLLAQVRLVSETGATPVLCLDDLPAELDSQHRNLILQRLHNYGAQIFVTATDGELFAKSYPDITSRVFHVEHGTVVAP